MDSLFSGLTHLLTPEGQQAIEKAHVCIIGIGGVGSWTVEALARTGVGQMTLIDLDEICQSNITRQVHTTVETIGHFKVDVSADRVQAINPQCRVHRIHEFLNRDNVAHLLPQHCFDFVFDAIDGVLSKCLIIDHCLKNRIPCLTVGASGALLSPEGIKITDLNQAHHDPLLTKVRQKLRRDFDYPKMEKKPWGIPALYLPRYTKAGEVQTRPQVNGARTCHQGLGAVSFVTGTYGFYAASFIVQHLLQAQKLKNLPKDPSWE